MLPANATDQTVTWSSSTANATVNASTGVVTAVAAGEATITATANDGSGVYATCTVTVLVPAADNAHTLASSAVGDIIGSNGQAYAAVYKGNLPTGVTAVAMVAYKGNQAECTNGLAIALEDVSNGTYTWDNAAGAVTTWASGKVNLGGTWCLPSQNQWWKMFKANGNNEYNYTGLNNALNAAGGVSSKLHENSNNNSYWTSTEYSTADKAYSVGLVSGGSASFGGDLKTSYNRVRACIAF